MPGVIPHILSDGGRGAFATPSTRLISQLEASIKDPKLLLDIVQAALDLLDKRFFVVASAYTQLKYTIINDASAAELTFKKG